MDQEKPLATLSIDMDNKWSYMKTHGDSGWEFYPSYFNVLVPYVLDLLDELELSITFFLVGRDVEREQNHRYIRMIAERGHEPGNHSFHHEPWLHLLQRDRIRGELEQTHQLISNVFGVAPLGFRGPGFSWSRELLEALLELGYRYDASTLPTFIGPLARLYYFWTADLNAEERQQRKRLFGTVADGFRAIRPYTWRLGGSGELLELPVTTIPIVRTPFHLSYLLYLSRYSPLLMRNYLQVAVTLCKMTGTPISFLLHPLDLLGGDQVPELRFFPGMDLDGKTKRQRFVQVMALLGRHFELVNMSSYASMVSADAAQRAVAVA
jgi:hypothetical protein